MRRLILAIGLSLLFIGCSEQQTSLTSPTPFVDTTLVLAYDKPVRVPGTKLTLTYDSLLFDARVTHPYAGELWYNTAGLDIVIGPSSQHAHVFISGDMPDSSGGWRVYGEPMVVDSLQFQLLSLNPPIEDESIRIPDSELVATIRVSRAPSAATYEVGFFPVALGNRWIYVDTFWVADTIYSISTDTIEIAREFYDASGRWGAFSGYLVPFEWYAMAHGDSIYSLQNGEGTPPPGHDMNFKVMEFIRAGDNPITYSALREGDMVYDKTVKKLDTAVTTPAGEFTGLYEYVGDPGYEQERQILKPDLGFVYIESVGTTGMGLSLRHHMWLKEYRLVNR